MMSVEISTVRSPTTVNDKDRLFGNRFRRFTMVDHFRRPIASAIVVDIFLILDSPILRLQLYMAAQNQK
jgi:hypothetical protein